ncbi:MAG: hypothetical protein H6671_13650 [Anaerolineaceae bacterium]|nr:hypothetical protein [Anaerolineaceae bacterium]
MAKRILTMTALSIFGVLLLLGILEVGLRWWFDTRGSEQEKALYLYDRATIDARAAQLIGVPYLNFTLNPDWEDVNARGIRGELVAVPKPAGVYRILALGGSTTFGHALNAEESWPAQLQRILRDEYGYTRVEVVNLGVPGYYSLDSVVSLATRGLMHQPDLIMDYDNLNDAVIRIYQDPACYSGDTPLYGFGMDRGIWQAAGAELPSSTLYRFVAYRLGWMDDPLAVNSRMEHTGWCPPEPGNISQLTLLASNPPVHFERNLRSIAALAESGGAQVLFSTYAWDRAAAESLLEADSSLDGTRALMMAIDEQNAIIQSIAADTGALVFDLAAQMTDGAYFQGDQVHQTAGGARRQAELYAQFLHEWGGIKSAEP